eukprot:TRINITY_DN6075_c0_g1_i11.p1 TRINITY_DN6075_c0_g1~~TRINITY_DN6075_c0_g1_i11.p1  ORF type:complete len:366 (+),score=73.73 TRINITY_DN6075_c0_g1_i11:59-1156(+)
MLHSAIQLLRQCHLEGAAATSEALDGLIALLEDEDSLSVGVDTDLIEVLIDGIRIHIRTKGTAKYVQALALCSNHGQLANEIQRCGGIGVLTKRLTSSDPDEVENAALTISNCNSADGGAVKSTKFSLPPNNCGDGAISIRINQMAFVDGGLGWKIWPAARFMSRFIHENPDFVRNKDVLEIGSGCGLVGLVAAQYANKVWMSDYQEKILQTITNNIEKNGLEEKACVRLLDWYDCCKEDYQPFHEPFDAIIGADIVYEVAHVKGLMAVLARYLSQDGVLYAVSANEREGSRELFRAATQAGYHVLALKVPHDIREQVYDMSRGDDHQQGLWNSFEFFSIFKSAAQGKKPLRPQGSQSWSAVLFD